MVLNGVQIYRLLDDCFRAVLQFVNFGKKHTHTHTEWSQLVTVVIVKYRKQLSRERLVISDWGGDDELHQSFHSVRLFQKAVDTHLS